MNFDLSFIYWAEVFKGVGDLFSIFGTVGLALGGMMWIVIFCLRIFEDNSKTIEKYEFILKRGKIIAIVSGIMLLIYSFIPSPTYVYAAGVAKNINNNASYVEETLEDAINKIVEAAKEIQKKDD